MLDLNDYCFNLMKRTNSMFGNDFLEIDNEYQSVPIKVKLMDEYPGSILSCKKINPIQQARILQRLGLSQPSKNQTMKAEELPKVENEENEILNNVISRCSKELIQAKNKIETDPEYESNENELGLSKIIYDSKQVVKLRETKKIKPKWHRPWKLMRVICGHQGWVRSLSVDPTNHWFATGSNDRTIKF